VCYQRGLEQRPALGPGCFALGFGSGFHSFGNEVSTVGDDQVVVNGIPWVSFGRPENLGLPKLMAAVVATYAHAHFLSN
jgi:hypothetical protein